MATSESSEQTAGSVDKITVTPNTRGSILINEAVATNPEVRVLPETPATDYNACQSSKKNALKQARKKEEESGKDNLDGLIFMCNSKTKLDCFRYRVFGLPGSEEKVVEKVKPGMKLFLFDYEERMMYGIYKASSTGGMKLEPDAFKGDNFRAQIRFRTHKLCWPLSDHILKKVVGDDYYGENKLTFELSCEQVKKLSVLIRGGRLDARVPVEPPLNKGEEPRREETRGKQIVKEQEELRCEEGSITTWDLCRFGVFIILMYMLWAFCADGCLLKYTRAHAVFAPIIVLWFTVALSRHLIDCRKRLLNSVAELLIERNGLRCTSIGQSIGAGVSQHRFAP